MRSWRSLLKNLIRPLPVQDHWERWFWRPALPITDTHRWTGWSSLADAAADEAKTKMHWWLFCSGVPTSVAVTRIYKDDLPRVTASRNQLDLSLSKCIGHGLIAKLNGNRRQRSCEALDQILVDYSCAHHAPAPITSPRHTPPHPVRRGEWARVYVSPFLLSSTYLQVHKEQPTL
jgi:hypothetical protein